MKILVVYASRASGNTRKVAEAIAGRLGDECRLFAAADAPLPDEFDFIALGFGVYRGWPDGDMIAYLKRCRNRDVGLFMTLGAWPDSDHAATCLGRAEGLLRQCRVRVRFACQGAYAPEFLARLKSLPPTSGHGWTPERAERVTEAMKHPDEHDLAEAREKFFQAVEKCRSKPEPKTAPPKTALVAAFFGSTVPGALRAYDRIEAELAARHPDLPLCRAYTSSVVRRKLGSRVPSLPGVLKRLVLEGYTGAEVMAGFLSGGEEYHQLLADVAAFANQLTIRVSRPPLSNLARLRAFVRRAAAAVPAARQPGEAVLFMGHGHHDGRSDFAYLAAAAELAKLDPAFHLACVEGQPGFAEVMAELASGRVWLVPFMLVAGDHALNDMAGDGPDSWRSQLVRAGHECECVLRGLGENPEVAAAFAAGLE